MKKNTEITKDFFAGSITVGVPADAAFYEEVARISTDWIWETNSEHRFTFIMYGSRKQKHYPINDSKNLVELGKFLGTIRWENILGKETKLPSNWQKHVDRLNQHLPFYCFKYEMLGRNATRFYGEISGIPRFSESGEFLGYRGTGRDRTAEQQSILSFQKVFQENPLPMLIFNVDNFNLMDSNDIFRDKYGYEKHDLKSKNVTDIFGAGARRDFKNLAIHNQAQDSGSRQFYAELYTGNNKLVQVEIITNRFNFEFRNALCCVIIDLTERKLMDKLRMSESRFRHLYNENPTTYFTLDKNYTIKNINAFGLSFLGYQRDEMVGQNVFGFYCQNSVDIAKKTLKQCFENIDRPANCTIQRTTKSNQLIWVNETYRVVHDEQGQLAALCVAEDITEKQELANKLEYDVLHDELTGVLNRRGFEQKAKSLFKSNEHQHIYAYLLLDLDRFKMTNDDAGHTAGDKILEHTAKAMKACLFESEIVGRLGGDEFALILKYIDVNDCNTRAQQILHAIKSQYVNVKQTKINTTASIGIKVIQNDSGHDLDMIQSQADSACYAAKQRGGDCYHLFDQKDNQVTFFNEGLRSTLLMSKAINQNRLALARQPIIKLDPTHKSKQELFAHEILLRMNVNGRYVSPSVMINRAEDFNFSPHIDRWVIDSTFKWCRKNFKNEDGRYFINLSKHSIVDNNLVIFIQNALDTYQLAPGNFVFEVTETHYAYNLNRVIENLQSLKKLGLGLALDDFGQGSSSLSDMLRLPLDFVKIDGEFIKDLATNKTHRSIVEFIHATAKSIGVETIAEIVESRESLEVLYDMGIKYGQGNYLGKPKLPNM